MCIVVLLQRDGMFQRRPRQRQVLGSPEPVLRADEQCRHFSLRDGGHSRASTVPARQELGVPLEALRQDWVPRTHHFPGEHPNRGGGGWGWSSPPYKMETSEVGAIAKA